MKRTLFFLLTLLFIGGGIARSSVYIQYYNNDSKTYTWEVKIAGTMTKVEFGGSRTSTVTIQGGASECIIFTNCGEIKILNNAKITIKNGCISIN